MNPEILAMSLKLRLRDGDIYKTPSKPNHSIVSSGLSRTIEMLIKTSFHFRFGIYCQHR